MAIKHAEDPYGSEGSTEYNAPKVDGSGAEPMNIRANPEDFGAQIGGAVQKVGETAEDLAVKYGNMVNETQATNADAAFAQASGKIKADYMSKSGMEAYNAYPAYQQAIQQAYQQSRQGLTIGATHAFDSLATKSMANHMADGSGFAAQQLKQATIDSGSTLQNISVQKLLDPDVATSESRTGEAIGHGIYGIQMQMDHEHPGLKTDPDTGTVSFDESKPEGQQLKQQYQKNVDTFISQAQVNRYTTLSNPNVMGVLPAYDLYQKNRDSLPPQAQVALDSSFAPKVFNAHKDNVASSTLSDAADAHAQLLYNPQSNISSAIHQQESGGKPHDYQIQPDTFKQYAKSGESFNNPADQDAVYGRIIGDLQKSYPSDAARQAVAYFSGKGNVSPAGSDTPYLRDTQDKNGKSVSSYVADINNRLGANSQIKTDNAAYYTTTKPKYGTNEGGTPLTQADYFRTHSADVYARGDDYAEKTMPGNLEFKRAVRTSLNQAMDVAIKNQTASYIADNKSLTRAINGDLTKNIPPESEQQLRAIPGVSNLIDKVAAQDPKFAEGIPTMISKIARGNVTTNSSNGYDTIMRVLEPQGEGHPNAIASQDHLDRLLGQSGGTGINMKDYNDAKPLLEADQDFKDGLSTHMQEIATANGNLDGKGQQRALQWYTQVMAAKKANDSRGDQKLSDADFLANIGEKDGPPAPAPPSRMQQIENWASSVLKNKQQGMLKVSSADDYNSIPKGQQYTDPDGNIRTKQ